MATPLDILVDTPDILFQHKAHGIHVAPSHHAWATHHLPLIQGHFKFESCGAQDKKVSQFYT